jgi:hypothetical protein
VAQWLRAHPFLFVGIASFFFFAPLVVLDLHPDSYLFSGLVVLWQTLGVGPHTASNLLAHYAPHIPKWLDVTLIVLLGLLPYAAADKILGHHRSRRTIPEFARDPSQP